MEIFDNGHWLPYTFALLMGIAVFAYAVLDGYDLGVGILSRFASPKERDTMIASVGPYWDANETWLILAFGLLLVAFPAASGIIMGMLYMPVTLMLLGLVLRAVAFDLRAKDKPERKELWDKVFAGSSFLIALTQGYMVGHFLLGMKTGLLPFAHCLLSGIAVAAAYCLIGAAWLIMKTEKELQKKTFGWAISSLRWMAVGFFVLAFVTPAISQDVFAKWTMFPRVLYVAPIPIAIVALVGWIEFITRGLPRSNGRGLWIPFALTALIILLACVGIGYSVFPYIVPGKLKLVDAAATPETLMILLVGALVTLPFILWYTIYSYQVFHGKSKDLSYE